MRSIVKMGKTVDEAVNEALVELNCSLDDVTIEILEEPKSGFLGIIGGRNAVVRVSSKVNEFDDLLKDDKVTEQEIVKEEVRDEKADQDDELIVENTRVVDTPVAPIRGDRQAEQRRPEKSVIDQDVAPVQREGDGEIADHQEVVDGLVVGNIQDQVDDNATTLDDEVVADVDEIGESLIDTETPDESDINLDEEPDMAEGTAAAADQVDDEGELLAYAEDLLNDILTRMHIDGKAVGKLSDGENIHVEIVDISDVDTGIIIGRRAETIDALQYVISIILNRKTTKHYRVFLDIGGYRERRRASIEKMAKRNAEKVRKYKKPITLEAMNAYERRVVHTALQGMDHIVTVSEGRDPHRKVVIRYGN